MKIMHKIKQVTVKELDDLKNLNKIKMKLMNRDS